MPLTAQSSKETHAAQNAALILLSLVFLPLDTFILFISLLYSLFISSAAEKSRRAALRTPGFRPRTVLVTGVGMSKGLTLTRIFYAAGHTVIGADFETPFLPTTCGRTSIALKKFMRLQRPHGSSGALAYAKSVVDIIVQEKVDLWVSCSGVASAIEDGMAKEMVEGLTSCRAIQFDVPTTQKLHEKHSFMEYTKSIGLAIPDTHTVTSKTAILSLLEPSRCKDRRYILKYIGTDDSVRANMTLLPLDTPSATKEYLSRIEVSTERPWILQQYIAGPEYCTHAVVIEGEVKAFVSCPSAELLMHYEALPQTSALSQSMLRFTQEYAAAGGQSFTGHLSFDFMVEAGEAEAAKRDATRQVKLYPIECNPRAHTAVVLFGNTPEMAAAYTSILNNTTSPPAGTTKHEQLTNGNAQKPVFPHKPARFHWIGHDLVNKLILPVSRLLTAKDASLQLLVHDLMTFLHYGLRWKDGTYEIWDPWPAWWLYHIYWPAQFAVALVLGRKWSRVNVSTCKMFMC
ncbi:hypothetical protein AMS68_002312 [Peltaster fructicola]|uniref:ATP-grasp domain-containing protein n=1 Tax=Peltaster fructicola TaxID=286661 RepID=A0A6H0XQ82_9PEZI|nr:hypothetical protein AMS68_002312 [Peltaster fructicola]